MVEANAPTKDVWKEQAAKAGKKRKNGKAFGQGGRMNWG